MYKKGEYVVYRHDVCRVNDIKERSGKIYYVMAPIDDESLTINIPVEDKMGFLRDVISIDKANELIRKIPKINPIEDINEKNIEGKYKELLNDGGYENLVRIIKTTYLRNESRVNNKKKASEKDTTYFDLAEKYLYNELSIALNMTVNEVKNYIFKIVNDNI